MFILALLLPLLTGCVVDMDDEDVQAAVDRAVAERLDAAVAAALPEAVDAALAEKGCLTADDLAAYATTDQLDALSAEVVHVLSEDTTWVVNTDEDLQDAVAALDSYRIPASITLTIELELGSYYPSGPLVFNHPDGGRIRVKGATGDAGDVVLTFLDSNGVVVNEGSSLGYLGDLTLRGGGLNSEDGVTVTDGSSAILGALVIDSFTNSQLMVSNGAFARCETTVCETEGWLTTEGGALGVVVTGGSAAVLSNLVVSGASTTGVSVERGSAVEAEYSSSTGNGGDGFTVSGASYADLAHSVASGNAVVGFRAAAGAGVSVSSSTASSNGYNGYEADYHAVVIAHSAISSENGGGFVARWNSSIDALDSCATGEFSYYVDYNSWMNAEGATCDLEVKSYSNDIADFVYGAGE